VRRETLKGKTLMKPVDTSFLLFFTENEMAVKKEDGG
jgi:hypothetical protein